MTELEIQIELQALISEREGMMALNQERIANGAALGYDEMAFQGNADAIRKLLEYV